MCKWFLILLLASILPNTSIAITEYQNWAFHFPANSNMGIFVALALPIEDPNENVFVAYNIEANYLLPGNESEIVEYPPLVSEENRENSKKIDRASIYKAIEAKLKSYNYPGRECVLRIICEVATSSLDHEGVLADLIKILFTPSTSINTELSSAYSNAEEYGKNKNSCKKYEKKCIKSFSDIITWIV